MGQEIAADQNAGNEEREEEERTRRVDLKKKMRDVFCKATSPLRPVVVQGKLLWGYWAGAHRAPAKIQTPPSYKENTPEITSRLLRPIIGAASAGF